MYRLAGTPPLAWADVLVLSTLRLLRAREGPASGLLGRHDQLDLIGVALAIRLSWVLPA